MGDSILCALEELQRERECRLANEAELRRADAELGELRARLTAISCIVRRALECGQIEKLEDAKPYLEDTDQSRHYYVGQCVHIRAAFTSLTLGTIDKLDEHGARINGIWFGWHELRAT